MIDLPEQPTDLRRVRLFSIFVSLGLLAILGRLWYLQIAHGEELQQQSLSNQLRLIRRVPPRGQITDRHGRVLATSRHQVVVSVVPEEMKKHPEVLLLLAGLLNRSAQELAEIVRENKVTSFDPVRVAEDVDAATVTRIEERRLDLPGVDIGPEPVRFYPDGLLCGHLLGQMGQIQPDELKARWNEGYRPGDYCGKLGLERAYDAVLHGENGGREIEVDARGRERNLVSNRDPIPGATLTLTIDRALQRVAYNALAALGSSSDPTRRKPGAAVALDPQTGAVLALVSTPSYDPNLFVKGISKPDWDRIRRNPLRPQINRAVGSAYAPGSTFKVVTAAAGLETGVYTPDRTDYCGGVIYLGRWPKRCHKRSGHGAVDMNDALAKSCDVYFYHLGQRLGPERMAQYAERFGLGKRTGIDLPKVETAGIVPTPAWKKKRWGQEWVGGETVDYAIGQAMLGCTPLQMCNIAAAIGNGGTLYRPQLVNSITTYDASHLPHIAHRLKPEAAGRLGVSPRTLDVLVRGMRAVMQPGGTGAASAIPGLTMAGKTGTAQMRRRGEMINNAWFIGFAPVERPRIAVCVFVEGGGHGGEVAAPIARKMIAQYLHFKLEGSGVGASTD